MPLSEEKEKRLKNLYEEWCFKHNAEDDALSDTVYEYEEDYFEDMTFKKDSLCYDIVSKVDEEEFVSLDIGSGYYRFFVIEDNGDMEGCTDTRERTISITRSNVNNKSVVLHEMIHAYVRILYDFNPTLLENIMLSLYLKLSPLIPDLDKKIKNHSELSSQIELDCSAGHHGLTFFLKSLDLDIRCGYPLGTICGYGRDSMNV